MRTRAILLALLALLCLTSPARAQGPAPLLVTGDGTNLFLTWERSTPPYTVLRGTRPDLLSVVDVTPLESWFDPGAAHVSDRNTYFYAVEDASPVPRRSNMGFKIALDLNEVPGSLNYYSLSFPYLRSFSDLWDSASGSLGSDGRTLSDDVLAGWATGGDGSCESAFPAECRGSLALLRFVREPSHYRFNMWAGQVIALSPLGSVVMNGSPYSVAAEPQEGFLAQVLYRSFPAVVLGSHDDGVTAARIGPDPNRARFLPFSIPPHTTWRTSQDLLLAAWNGRLDQTPGAGYILSFLTPSNDPARGFLYGQTVAESRVRPGTPSFSGQPVPLRPGIGCLLVPEWGSTDLPLPHY